jgi:hypothetical protein
MDNLTRTHFPEDHAAYNYILTILGRGIDFSRNKSYIPAARLPANFHECEKYLQRIYSLLHHDKTICGGEMPFKHVITELVTNIYEHSCFTMANVMAQRYRNKGFVELCFFDNGVTIYGNYKRHGYDYQPLEAIKFALKGKSTKGGTERGFGLSTSMRMFVEGLSGEFMIVSGAAGIYLTTAHKLGFNLRDEHHLQGTLVSVKVPYPCQLLSEELFYRFVEDR